MTQQTALVTGSAGFVGYHTCERLLSEGFRVIGFDAMTDYYDVALKEARHARLARHAAFEAVLDRCEAPGVLANLLAERRPDIVIHLAAQAGVRFSIDEPRSYVEANINGTFELLEAARATPPRHLLIASTSSVYGANKQMPYREVDKADLQMSFYAATKKATEAMAQTYAHLYGIPTTMFRFFTVYGPWGRPDMALFKFTRAILAGESIDIYNHGQMKRDFTYVEDLIEGLRRLIDVLPTHAVSADSLSPVAPWRVVNIGHGEPIALMDYVAALESALGQEAKKTFLPHQPGEVFETWADTELLTQLVGPLPKTDLATGVGRFVEWYRSYHAEQTA